MYKILKICGNAKRAEFHTPHGIIQTPVFMNVATCGAIKGALSTIDLKKTNVRLFCLTPIICIYGRAMI